MSQRSQARVEQITELLTPIVTDAGYFLEGVELTSAGKHSTLRVIVDLTEGTDSIDLDSVAEVTELVSAALDEADPISHEYVLEVSSPGAERRLQTERHWHRAVGRTITVSTQEETHKGVLQEVEGGSAVILTDNGPLTVRLEDVTQAQQIVTM